jgi:hypothetical protein
LEEGQDGSDGIFDSLGYVWGGWGFEVREEAAVGGVLLGFVDGDGVGVCSWEGGVSLG